MSVPDSRNRSNAEACEFTESWRSDVVNWSVMRTWDGRGVRVPVRLNNGRRPILAFGKFDRGRRTGRPVSVQVAVEAPRVPQVGRRCFSETQ